MPKEKHIVYFAERGATYTPKQVLAEPIVIGGVEFFVCAAHDHLNRKVAGKKTLFRNGIPIHRFSEEVEDVAKYIKGKVRETFPDGDGGVDREAFIQGLMNHYKLSEDVAGFYREFYRGERRYLEKNMKVKKNV